MKNLIILFFCLFGYIGLSQEKITTVTQNTISLTTADSLLNEVIERAEKKGFSLVAAVVDRNGDLIGLKRMDNSAIGPIDVAVKKARTAALFQMNSLDFGELAKPNAPIYTIENTNGGMISFGGGVKLIHKGALIGALGVAGATVEEDDIIAKEAVKAFSLAK